MTNVRRIALVAVVLTAGCAGSRLEPAEPGAHEQGLTAAQLVEVARELDRRGDSLRAEQYWMEALDRGASADDVLPRLMAAYVRDRQYRLAAQRAEDHLRRHPNSTRVRLLLAALYQAVEDYTRAVAEYRSVVRAEPKQANAHFALATALTAEGHDRVSADDHYRKYLELAPNGTYAERAEAALLTEVVQ